MTARSAMTDANGQVVKCTQPAGLADVFGIRLGGILVNQDKKSFDEIELRGAKIVATEDFFGKTLPLVTENKYGKGRAIYVGTSAGGDDVSSVIESAIDALKIKKGPDVPDRVSARWIDPAHLLLLNHSSEDKVIKVGKKCKSVLTGESYSGTVVLKANDADFLQF